MQSTSENELVGVSGRAELLRRLGDSLLKMPHVFGLNGRPGNMIGESYSHPFLWTP